MDTNGENKVLFQLSERERAQWAEALWAECRSRAENCTACELSKTRHNVVFGVGNPSASLMFIGEGPGEDEDLQGIPFVGNAGQLLTQILSAAGIDRKEVYIANIVKCRPPKNREPYPAEMQACDAHLQTQILLVKPVILVTLGNTPTKRLLSTTQGITRLRGKWVNWRGIAVMPMFHPSYLLRNPNDKKPGSPKHLSWLDIQEVKRQWDHVRSTGRLEDVYLDG